MIKKTKKCIVHFNTLFVISIMFLTSFSVFGAMGREIKDDEAVVVTYDFEQPIVEKKTIDDVEYDQIILKDVSYGGNSGEPQLPIASARIFLPPGTKVCSIEATVEELSLGSGFNIASCREPVPISGEISSSQPTPNEIIYSSADPFPGEIFSYVGTYSFRGYSIAILQLFPVQYVPSTGEITYYKTITVTVNLESDEQSNLLYRGTAVDKQKVLNKVDNPSVAERYPVESQPAPLEAYDLLIITTDSLASSFQDLVDFHNNQGVNTVVRTLTDIGNNDPDDIRDYIRQEYDENNIRYVLIGGDHDVVPAKMLYVESGQGENTEMPSDLYYACLDGPFDFNGNGKWGEPNDGENGGDIDLVADVYVGRASVGSATEVEHFVEKTIAYVQAQHIYLNKVLMVGEHLCWDPLTYGDEYMEELIDGSDSNGYSTVGVPSGEYAIHRLYDRMHWSPSELKDYINNNLHMINHLGHAQWDMNMKLYISDVDGLTNDKYFFVYSQGCWAGRFDYSSDCIAEHFTVKTGHGAFAGVWNARYGWYMPGSTDGPSQHYHREFIDAIFGENIPILGEANHDSKEDNIYRVNETAMRWCYYGTNLFGDPTIAFHEAVQAPTVEIQEIAGGASLGVTLKNTGEIDASDVQYRITVDGGLLNLIHLDVEDTISSLESGETAIIKTPILGLGNVNITITVNVEGTTPVVEGPKAFVLFFLVKVLS